MISVTISAEVAQACPSLEVVAIACEVVNTPSNKQLWSALSEAAANVRANLRIEDINKLAPIHATRQAYKYFGKDPNRYRPSAEALLRRILRELPLYRINTVVDIINLVSIQSSFSIGGFDLDKIDSGLVLGVGKTDETYNAIGRGLLNIEGLPVYRDRTGGIGTPTSDEERTKIDLNTTHVLMIINGYSGAENLEETAFSAISLLMDYVSATHIEATWLNTQGYKKTIHSIC